MSRRTRGEEVDYPANLLCSYVEDGMNRRSVGDAVDAERGEAIAGVVVIAGFAGLVSESAVGELLATEQDVLRKGVDVAGVGGLQSIVGGTDVGVGRGEVERG